MDMIWILGVMVFLKGLYSEMIMEQVKLFILSMKNHTWQRQTGKVEYPNLLHKCWIGRTQCNSILLSTSVGDIIKAIDFVQGRCNTLAFNWSGQRKYKCLGPLRYRILVSQTDTCYSPKGRVLRGSDNHILQIWILSFMRRKELNCIIGKTHLKNINKYISNG